MGNPNPFYRFKTAWNAGFYPDNQIESDLLNEIYTNLIGLLPTWAIVGTTKVPNLYQTVRNYVNTYNASPIFGGFEVNLEYDVLSPGDFRIVIIDPNLYVIDNTQFLEIYGEYLSTSNRVLTIPVILNPFSVGSYTGTFDAPLIPEESKVREALNVVDMNGSAIFPITYSFDPSTNVATSGLARGKDWKLNNGIINRFPVPTLPYENQRTFELPQLNGDDTYIISIMERIIQASFIDPDYTTSILATYNSFSLPDGWNGYVSHPGFSTYERVQFDFVNGTRRSFSLVGRKDSTWLWQRFVTDDFPSGPYDFLANYVEVDALPYEPMQAGRWTYSESTFDFEFVDFTSGCYVSPEFYPMPAKPGDQLQFKVVDANLTGVTNAKVGLFTQSGQFVQKIGDAELGNQSCPSIALNSSQFNASVTIPSKQGCYRMGLYEGDGGGPSPSTCQLVLTLSLDQDSIEFNQWITAVNEVATTGTGILGIYVNGLDTVYTYNVSGTIDYVSFFAFLNTIPGMVATYGPGFSFQWTWTVDVPCGDGVYFIDQCEWDGTSCISNVYSSEDIQNCECSGGIGTGNGYLYSLSNIINIDRAECFSTILEFWSDNNTIAEGFEYFNDWKQRIRIGLNGGGEKPVIEESLYRQSNGVHRRPQNKQDLSIDLHTDFFDLETQLAMTDATRHPYFVWNGQSVFIKGDLDVATIQDFTTETSFETLSQMKFQVLKQGFQPKNSSCLNC